MSEIKNYYYCYYFYYYYYYTVQITICFTPLHSVHTNGLHTQRHIADLGVCKRSTETSTHAPHVMS